MSCSGHWRSCDENEKVASLQRARAGKETKLAPLREPGFDLPSSNQLFLCPQHPFPIPLLDSKSLT